MDDNLRQTKSTLGETECVLFCRSCLPCPTKNPSTFKKMLRSLILYSYLFCNHTHWVFSSTPKALQRTLGTPRLQNCLLSSLSMDSRGEIGRCKGFSLLWLPTPIVTFWEGGIFGVLHWICELVMSRKPDLVGELEHFHGHIMLVAWLIFS